MRLLFLSLLCQLTIVVPAAGQSLEENQFVMVLRQAKLSCSGAANSTKQKIVDGLRNDLQGERVQIHSGVVTEFNEFKSMQFRRLGSRAEGSVSLVYSFTGGEGPMFRYCDMSSLDESERSSIFGQLLGLPPSRSVDQCSYTTGGARAFGLPMCPDWAGIADSSPVLYSVSLSKKYQDIAVEYEVLTKNQTTLDDLRVGQKITLQFILLGVLDWGGNLNVFGVLDSVQPETQVLRCSNGHEYAPAAGFRFCPQCGEPLK